MLKSITFENYKAFIKGNLEFRPITILLGANSVGKSSIIQLLLMLQQTAIVKNGYEKFLFKLNGNNVSMGDYLNLIRNHDKRRLLSFTFGLDSGFCRIFKKTIKETFFFMIDYISMFSPNFKLTHRELDIACEDEIKDVLFKFKQANHTLYNNLPERFRALLDNTDEYIQTFEFLSKVSRHLSDNSDISVVVVSQCTSSTKTRTHNMNLDRLSVCSGGKEIIGVKRRSAKRFTLESSLFSNEDWNFLNTNKVKKDLKALIPDISGNLFSIFDNVASWGGLSQIEENTGRSYFITTLTFMLKIALNFVKKSFSETSVNYVSPLRAYPKRFYFLDRTSVTGSLDTLDGDSLTELLKDNNTLKENVNKWLNHFGLEIDVEAVEDIIHKLKVNQNGLSLDITDVGFGISQILPVIVQGFFTSSRSLTVIEQPEVHLHPIY